MATNKKVDQILSKCPQSWVFQTNISWASALHYALLHYTMSRLDSFVLLNTCGLLQVKVALFKGYCAIDQQMICCNII